MRLKVYILDASYEVISREPHVILWGIDESGRRVLLRDRKFRPYFYVVPENPDIIERIAKEIRRFSKPSSPIISINIIKRKYYGRPVEAIKVTTVIPEYVREYREVAKKLLGVREVLEADIRFAMRYLVDKDISPCTWHIFEVKELSRSPMYRVDAIYEIEQVVEKIEEPLPPKMKILAFDIEVYNPRGTPRPGQDPIIIIAAMTSEGEIKQFIAKNKDDREVIKNFIEFVQSYDPDIIVGYNSDKFDWPYLLERAKALGIKLDVSRVRGVEPRTSVYGHISIPGRLNVDLYNFAEEIQEVKVKTLENIAEFLGVMKKSERTIIPWYEMPKYWDNPSLRPLFIKYSKEDVISTMGIAEKILPFAIQLSALTGMPLDQVGAASVGFRLEWYLIRAAYKYNELVPNRVERPYEPYRGAIVLEPIRGVHENIAVLDFSAMYPSIMMKYNVGPDTYAESEEECEPIGCWVAPEVGYRFRKEPPGFFKIVLQTLVSARKKIREEMKRHSPDSYEYRILDERQRALKILANATYGYMGWVGARWYFRQGAEAVTAWGRQTIKTAISIAKELGLKVIYGDTDSLFASYDSEKINKLIEKIKSELGLEIKIDKIYRRVFFTEAKKRYVGLTQEGRIDIVGFEAVRGDWAEIAKEVQEEVAKVILREMDTNKAIEYVRSVVKELTGGKIPIEKLIIWKTISKRIEEYEVDAPHVTAAKILLRHGYKVEVGDKIGYVIVKGSGNISSRARPYTMVTSQDIDTSYYIDHQIVPAALRILEYFGVSEKQLKVASRGVRTLFDFAAKKRVKR